MGACPIAAGTTSVPLSATLAGALPASLAHTTVALTAQTSGGDKLVCLNVDLKKEDTAPGIDCTKAACQSQCECSLKSCSDPINACLADATCATGQACAQACACSDTACMLNCATQAGSPLALPVATCINSKCSSDAAWEKFKADFGKNYAAEEESMRKAIFAENMEYINTLD